MEVWIGHPVWVAHRAGAALYLSPGVEPGESETGPRKREPIWRIDATAFADAVAEAKRGVEAARVPFERALADAVSPDRVRALVATLLGVQEATE